MTAGWRPRRWTAGEASTNALLPGDPIHLTEAKRLLDHLVEHAPEEYRESMLKNVRLHREIMEAWEENGGEGEYTHVNVFLGLLEPVSRSLVYAGGTTYPPLLRRAGGEIQSLCETRPTLGLPTDAEYEASAPIKLEPGDVLLVCTEWLVDNWGGGSDGQQNVEASLARQALPNRSAEEILAGLFADFDAFDGRHAYADSLALVIKAPS